MPISCGQLTCKAQQGIKYYTVWCNPWEYWVTNQQLMQALSSRHNWICMDSHSIPPKNFQVLQHCSIFAWTGGQQNVPRVAVVDQILFIQMSLSIQWVCKFDAICCTSWTCTECLEKPTHSHSLSWPLSLGSWEGTRHGMWADKHKVYLFAEWSQLFCSFWTRKPVRFLNVGAISK